MKRDAYKQKMEAELERAQARLTELKATAKSKVADARIECDKQVAHLEERMAATRSKLKELADAGDDAWETIKDGVEEAWASLSDGIKNAVDQFKK